MKKKTFRVAWNEERRNHCSHRIYDFIDFLLRFIEFDGSHTKRKSNILTKHTRALHLYAICCRVYAIHEPHRTIEIQSVCVFFNFGV